MDKMIFTAESMTGDRYLIIKLNYISFLFPLMSIRFPPSDQNFIFSRGFIEEKMIDIM